MKITVSEKIDFLSSFIKNLKLEKDNINVSIWCPFCKHSNKNKLKLTIHLEKNYYHCWLCDYKGSNVLSIIKRIDKSKIEKAKKFFKQNYKGSFSLNLFGKDNDTFIVEEVNFPLKFKTVANNFNIKNKNCLDVINYSISRGFNKHKVWLLKPGFSLDRNYERYMIIPSFDCNGDINFFTSRHIDKSSSDSYKYKNASISKKYIIFNELNIDWNIPLTLVEGPLDLIKTNDNATCLLGSSLTEDMLLFKKIVENKTDVYLALDRDAYSKAIKIAKMLCQYDINVKMIDTRSYEDVGSMSRDHFNKKYKEANTFTQDDVLYNKIKNL